jgi:hypothetical protein
VSLCGVPFAAAGAQAADAAFRFRLCCRLNISKHTTPCAVPRLSPPVSPSSQVVALAGRSAERLVLGDANISTVGASQLQVSFFSYCIADCWYCAAEPVSVRIASNRIALLPHNPSIGACWNFALASLQLLPLPINFLLSPSADAQRNTHTCTTLPRHYLHHRNCLLYRADCQPDCEGDDFPMRIQVGAAVA